jgi:VIT1/CCC1 family predicted Fe2+/Mn2+ transporter
MQTISPELRQKLLGMQQDEITAHHAYRSIASALPDSENRQVLEKIARDELGHAAVWEKYTKTELQPNRFQVGLYSLLSRVLGFTFAIKLLERGEELAQVGYAEITSAIPEAGKILADEDEHEERLIGMLDEERLRYASSVVLGLNDALVELTGALAGFTLALQDVRLIALSGLITGIAASMSMAASEYLATRAEDTTKHPVRAAVYTGIAYVVTVALLILPYLLLENEYVCLAISLATAVIIIALFNYYISIAKGENFRRRFAEMAGLSLGVALFSFIISYFIRMWLGVEV